MSSRSSKRLNTPLPAQVCVGAGGVPTAVGTIAVDSVREDWVIEDRWWNKMPVRRLYFELVLTDGRNVVVLHDLISGRWMTQRG